MVKVHYDISMLYLENFVLLLCAINSHMLYGDPNGVLRYLNVLNCISVPGSILVVQWLRCLKCALVF